MDSVEGSLPRHSDYEDDFAEAGLGQPSYGDDEEDTYDTSCTGIRDIIFTGSVRHVFSVACSPSSSAFVSTDRSLSQHGLGAVYVPWPRAFMGWPACACSCLGMLSPFRPSSTLSAFLI